MRAGTAISEVKFDVDVGEAEREDEERRVTVAVLSLSCEVCRVWQIVREPAVEGREESGCDEHW